MLLRAFRSETPSSGRAKGSTAWAYLADAGDLARDREALLDLVRLVEDRRARLEAEGEPTGDTDALLAKLHWELAALGAP